MNFETVYVAIFRQSLSDARFTHLAPVSGHCPWPANHVRQWWAIFNSNSAYQFGCNILTAISPLIKWAIVQYSFYYYYYDDHDENGDGCDDGDAIDDDDNDDDDDSEMMVRQR